MITLENDKLWLTCNECGGNKGHATPVRDGMDYIACKPCNGQGKTLLDLPIELLEKITNEIKENGSVSSETEAKVLSLL